MHNNIKHDRNVNTYLSTDTVKPPVTPPKLPIATDDSVTLETCSMATINVLKNDNQGSGNATVAVTSGPSNGTALVLAYGSIKYTPNDNYVGSDSFKYTITDSNGNTSTATVNVTVTGQCQSGNTAPDAVDDAKTTAMNTAVSVDVTGNDTDPEGDNLTVTSFTQGSNGMVTQAANGDLIYTPNNGFSGTDTFTYTISDGNGGVDTATVTITVPAAPTNVAPVANDDMATAGCDAITIKVLENDTDADKGDVLSILSLGDPSLGTAVIKGNNVVYTPVHSCGTGVDTFTYTISDGHGHTDTASIKVSVNGDGTCSTGCTIAESDDIATTVDTPVSINVLSNDSGSGLMIVEVDNPNHGTAMIMGNSIKYTPAAGFTGTDSFWYGIKDDKGYETSALIVVYVEEAGCNAKCD
jgi:hypothetical protein